MSVPGATIRPMLSDLERLPARVQSAAPGAGPAAVAAELLSRMRAELPAVGELGEREQVLVAAWLTGLRSARTRRAYAGDAAAWLAVRDTDVLAAARVHVDLWAATQLDAGAAASSVRRRLSALSSFYRYCAAHEFARPSPGRAPNRDFSFPCYFSPEPLLAADLQVGLELRGIGHRHLEEHRGLVLRNPVDLPLLLPFGLVFLLVPLVRLVGDHVDDAGGDRLPQSDPSP
jgi:hypothetical protein